jgi:uncharacterized membrane protein YjgN (DUF898 family)
MLLLPALIVMSMRFRMRYTSWRNIQFSFQPNFKKAYLLFGIPLLLFAFVLYGGSQINRIAEEYPEFQNTEQSFLVEDTGQDGLVYDEDEVWDEDSEYIDEEIELSEEEAQRASEFQEQLFQALGIAYIPLAIFWLLYPWWLRFYYTFLADHSRYGTSHFSFIGTTAEFYSIYIIASLISIPFGIAAAVLAMGTGALFSETKAVMAIVGPIAVIGPMMAINAYIQTKKTNVIYSGLTLEDIGFTSELKFGKMFWLYFSNTFAILLSLGLLIPWAKIRMARYRAECMTLYASDFDAFQARINRDQGAQAAEFSEVMDFDLGL